MALYHSYRPQSFDDVLGQPHIVAVLKSAITNDRVGHAYLFSGPRGVGKTSIARILAKAINCQNRESGIVNRELGTQTIPCNTCATCVAITNGSALDVIEIDAASNRGIDEIRELRDRVRFAPTELKKKVYIIDEVHMLTKEAFNALLKTLEEPPSHAVFVLATTELAKIPETIFSRCQHFQFRRAATEAVGKHLTAIAKDEGRTIDADALDLLVLRSEGSYRDALSAFEQVLTADTKSVITADRVRELFGLPPEEVALDLLAAIAVGDRARILESLESLATEGVSLESFLAELIRVVRLLLFVATLGPDRFGGGSATFRTALPALLDAFNETELIGLLLTLTEALAAMRTSPLPSLPVELALLGEATKRAPASQPRPRVVVASPSEVIKSPVAEPKVDPKPAPVIDEAPIPNDPDTAKPVDSVQELKDTPAPSTELTHEAWRSIRQNLAKQDSSFTMIFGELAEPPQVVGDQVIIVVPYKFHVDRLMAAKARGLIETALSKAIGRSVTIDCSVAPTAARRSAKRSPVESIPVGQVVEDVVGALSDL